MFFHTLCFGSDCAPENPDNGGNGGNGNDDGVAAKSKGAAVGAVFGVLVVLGVFGYYVYTRKTGTANIYNRLDGIRADDNADLSSADDSDDDIAMVDMGTPGGGAFKRHDPNSEKDADDAFGEDGEDLLM